MSCNVDTIPDCLYGYNRLEDHIQLWRVITQSFAARSTNANAATLQAQACATGIGKVDDPITLLQIIAELTREVAVGTQTPCQSGIAKLMDDHQILQRIAALACTP